MGLFSRKTEDEKFWEKIHKLNKKKETFFDEDGRSYISGKNHYPEIFQLFDKRISLALELGEWDKIDEIWINKYVNYTHALVYHLIDDRELFKFLHESLNLNWHDVDNFGAGGQVTNGLVLKFLIPFLYRRGKYSQATEYFNQFNAIETNSQLASEEKQNTMDEFMQMMVNDAKEAEILNDKGMMCMEALDYSLAESAFQQCVNLNPGKVIYRVNLSTALSKLGKRLESMQQITRCREMDEKNY